MIAAITAGVPVLSIAKTYICQRQTSAYIKIIGCDELICKNFEQLSVAASKMISDVKYYAQVKKTFIQNRKLVLDLSKFMDQF